MKVSYIKGIIEEEDSEKKKQGFPVFEFLIKNANYISILREYGFPVSAEEEGKLSPIEVLEWFEKEKNVKVDITSLIIKVNDIPIAGGSDSILFESFEYHAGSFPPTSLKYLCYKTAIMILEHIMSLSPKSSQK